MVLNLCIIYSLVAFVIFMCDTSSVEWLTMAWVIAFIFTVVGLSFLGGKAQVPLVGIYKGNGSVSF